MTAGNLGVIATVRGDDPEALRFYESVLSDARTAGLVEEAINALVNMGQLHMHMGRYDDSERAFTEAMQMSDGVGDVSRVMRIELYLARLRIKQGEQHSARASWEHARDIADQIGDRSADGEAEHIAGIIARLDGDVTRAEAHFIRDELIAVDRRELILQGETAREIAELYRWNGRNKDTLQRLNGLYSMPVLGGTPRQLVRDVDTAVTFSPDGQRLAFVRGVPNAGKARLLIANVDGTGEQTIWEADAEINSRGILAPDWSPDGRSIAMSSGMRGVGTLSIVTVADKTARTLYRHQGNIGRPRWTPNGDALLVPLDTLIADRAKFDFHDAHVGRRARRIAPQHTLDFVAVRCLGAEMPILFWRDIEP